MASPGLSNEERERLRALLAGLDEPGAPSFAPVDNPVSRYGQLPGNTRVFFERLRQEDIDDWWRVLKLYRATVSVGRFTKWLIITLVGFFVGTVAFGEKVLALLSWFKD